MSISYQKHHDNMTTTNIYDGIPDACHNDLRQLHRTDERRAIAALLPLIQFSDDSRARLLETARQRVTIQRERLSQRSGPAALLHEYALSSTEGVALMCLAEALLRIPDPATVDQLIQDKIGPIDWARHIAHSDHLFINAAHWALMLSGRFLHLENHETSLSGASRRLLARAGEPLIRQAMRAAMRLLGEQFILGRTISEALSHARPAEQRGYRHSYDMLGEAALSMASAERYRNAYHHAIAAIGQQWQTTCPAASMTTPTPAQAPSISIKLSALHPRYEQSQQMRVMTELLPVVRELALHASQLGLGLTLDAEESDRLELSLDLFNALAKDPALAAWQGLGLAVQAYQKRAPAVIDELAALSRRSGRRLMVRLVKGAYWDAEIKWAQERGLDDYPVYTHKSATDISYLACARKLLDDPAAFYPQFATHNAHTLASVLELARLRGLGAQGNDDFEFQRLHGMGAELHDQIVTDFPCRIYAPVGSHEDLLAYLARRLLENGANSSFVHRLEDPTTPLDTLLRDPVELWHQDNDPGQAQPLPAPRALFSPERRNSLGLDLADPITLKKIQTALKGAWINDLRAYPSKKRMDTCSSSHAIEPPWQSVTSPADHRRQLGRVLHADVAAIDLALTAAHRAQPAWDATPAAQRAACLERAADRLEQRILDFIALIVHEGGRTLADAMNEVREAVDFCRYYAAQARAEFGTPRELPGPTGERNQLSLHGRGVFACISPWNFPLAIFIGQVSAALAAGNSVIAKPAQQTPLTAAAAIDLLHEAGIPDDVLHLLPGDAQTGAHLIADARIAGVAFTGSSQTARHIARSLANRSGLNDTPLPLIPLIAETGGINVMIADSSALPEQLVRDALDSAFNSAGQRCSALRILLLQNDIAPAVLELLASALRERTLGDPSLINTDIGPLIDTAACNRLAAHVQALEHMPGACLIARNELPSGSTHGTFFPPQIWEIDRIDRIDHETFGPILHVVRWRNEQLDEILNQIDALGYGLTLGIHSRIDRRIEHIVRHSHAGNIYINRNMIGAVVGSQPFGGERLSGTGPKAGGPHTLLRYATERCLTINTTAAGGNTQLMAGHNPHAPPAPHDPHAPPDQSV
jgi:RHH-type proline utilization regulon transcriptional repressor/proline dehydrogenase/delta 1-pyrroline-5-carboxylate dehydrogenase